MTTTDPLGPTGNTSDPCRWCGVAHHPMTACGLDDMRNEIDRLRAELAAANARFAEMNTPTGREIELQTKIERLRAEMPSVGNPAYHVSLGLSSGERSDFERDMM